MMMAELFAPEFIEIVAAGIVQAGELLIVEGGLTRGPTEVAHRREEILAALPDDDPGIHHGENPVVVGFRFTAAQVGQLRRQRFNLPLASPTGVGPGGD